MELRDTYEKADIHDEWESVYRGNPTQTRFNDTIIDRVLQLVDVPKGSQFLDAGCGIGDHTIRIARRGYAVTGVDISETILARARQSARAAGLDDRVEFTCQSLERLELPSSVDVVHCRGVLMHIPNWEAALASLCRVLRPGGKIVIFETNHRSVDTLIVSLVRKVSQRKSRLVRTPGGLEFWSERDGTPFVVRAANVQTLENALATNGMRPVHRFASEFWEINRFPSGFARNAAIRFNQLWFALRLPSVPSAGNIVIAEKNPV